MKSKRIKILLLAFLFFLRLGYANFSVYAKSESQIYLHDELPGADQCSVMTIHIREMALSLKETVKERSSLDSPVQSALENHEDYLQRLHEYEQSMELLQERASSLRKQMDAKEETLVDCLQNNITPLDQKKLQTTKKNREVE